VPRVNLLSQRVERVRLDPDTCACVVLGRCRQTCSIACVLTYRALLQMMCLAGGGPDHVLCSWDSLSRAVACSLLNPAGGAHYSAVLFPSDTFQIVYRLPPVEHVFFLVCCDKKALLWQEPV